MKRRYSKQNWLQSLGDDNNVILLLYFIHTQSVLSKQDEFLNSGFTIEDFEAGGLIYLEQYNGNDFIPRAPLILISVLVDYFDLSGIFDKLLLNPFNLLTEDTFPQFVLRMHQATYGLAFRLGIPTISFTEIYGGYSFCSKHFRACEIEVKQVEYYDIDLLVNEEKKAKDTGCERFILISPKTFKMEDRSEIPENCAVVARSDLINFIGPYALVISHLTLSYSFPPVS